VKKHLVAEKKLLIGCQSLLLHLHMAIIKGGLLWLAPLTTTGLGIWQLYRLQWKRDLIQQSENKLNNAPIPLDINSATDLSQFARVKLDGSFQHDREMLVGLRTRVTNETSGGLIGGSSKLGYYVITPFKPKGSSETVLVNRGFIAKNLKTTEERKTGKAAQEVTINGIVRDGEPDQLFGVANNPAKNEWCLVNLEMMAQHAGSKRVLVEMTDSDNPEFKVMGYPIMRDPRVTLPNNHAEYALTWYPLE
jgi:surfeit locus 1 family protein